MISLPTLIEQSCRLHSMVLQRVAFVNNKLVELSWPEQPEMKRIGLARLPFKICCS